MMFRLKVVYDMEGYSTENFETIEIKPFWLSELDHFNFQVNPTVISYHISYQVRENEIIEWGKL